MNEVIKKLNVEKIKLVSLNNYDLTKPDNVLKVGNVIRGYSILFDEHLKPVGDVTPFYFYINEIKFPFIKIYPVDKDFEVLNNKITLEFFESINNAPATSAKGEKVFVSFMRFSVVNTQQKADVLEIGIESNLKFIEKTTKEIKKVKKTKKIKNKKVAKK